MTASKLLPRFLLRFCFAVFAASALFSPALAGEPMKAPSSGLPGVKGDYRIVKPPVPEPDDRADSGNSVKVGNFDVRVSGFVRAEAGFGNEMEINPEK